MIAIDRHDPTPFYRQLYRQVVEGIQTGVYHADDRLPSIRSFASDLGISRNTVEQAYLMLVEEGYVRARQGSGYYIERVRAKGEPAVRADPMLAEGLAELEERDRQMAQGRPAFDLSGAAMEDGAFPVYRWASIAREVMLDEGREALCRPMDPRGIDELRAQIARHLARETDVVAQASQVAVFPSAPAALDAIGTAVGADGLAIRDIRGCALDSEPPTAPADAVVLGSFDCTLGPAMAFAFAVPPPKAMLAWLQAGAPGGGHVPWHMQATLAEFMRQGLWHSHLRRLQTQCRRKRKELDIQVKTQLGSVVAVDREARGPYVALRARDGRDGAALAQQAAACGVAVRADGERVLLGYSAIPLPEIPLAVRALSRAWCGD